MEDAGSRLRELSPAPAWTRALPWSWLWALGQLPPLRYWLLRCLLARDSRTLCRILHLQGWQHWPTAQNHPDHRRLKLVLSSRGTWPLAAWAVAHFRGPVMLADYRLSLEAPAMPARMEHHLIFDQAPQAADCRLRVEATACAKGRFKIELQALKSTPEGHYAD